jgi:hypothetical protein
MNTDKILEEAKVSSVAAYVLERDGYRSRAYWHQVDKEFERIRKRELENKRASAPSMSKWLAPA